MKTYICLLLIALPLVFSFSRQDKKRIVFFGDSITQQGGGPEGYINKLDSIVRSKSLSRGYELLGAGIGGNKVYDLYLRMDSDVLQKKPDAVVVFVGINDVWHKRTSGTGTDPDKFEKFYNAIIKKIRDNGASVLLCTPPAIGEKNDMTNPLDGDLNNYAAIIRKIAKNNDCPVIDLRDAFLSYLKTNNPDNKDRNILTTDGVHLNALGNRFVAGKMYEVLSKTVIH